MDIALILSSNINTYIVILLMAVGFGIKHIKFLSKVNNNVIPATLMILGILMALAINYPYFNIVDTLPQIASGIASAATAIGLHQSGKTLINSTKEINNIENNNDNSDGSVG